MILFELIGFGYLEFKHQINIAGFDELLAMYANMWRRQCGMCYAHSKAHHRLRPRSADTHASRFKRELINLLLNG